MCIRDSSNTWAEMVRKRQFYDRHGVDEHEAARAEHEAARADAAERRLSELEARLAALERTQSGT